MTRERNVVSGSGGPPCGNQPVLLVNRLYVKDVYMLWVADCKGVGIADCKGGG